MGLFSRNQTPTPEDRYYADKEISDARRANAANRYRATGDSSRMWAEKARHVDAVNKVRAYESTPQGRREARRNRRNGS
ncbi:hypothetical protein [Streptomyces sp. NPDC093589]|uniref:hypothetical protein n=1 Tax=Streptomyces sp. NPDC093589 TaxID=3366043 RepID=UPI003819D243